MIKIKSMDHFQNVCKKKLVDRYNVAMRRTITVEDIYVVWACKTLQNYKALLSTNVDGDGIYAEYTYDGDKHQLYADIYGKIENICHTEE